MMENNPIIWREILKNKIIQGEEFNMKESWQRFSFNKPLFGAMEYTDCISAEG